MSSVYIISDHGKLAKRDETLLFKQAGGPERIIFPFKTEQLLIIGNVSISGAALRLLMRHKIATIFISANGRFNGKIVFGENKNVFLRQKQYQILADSQQSIIFAKNIIHGKLKNEITFLQRLNRSHSLSVDDSGQVEEAINAIKNLADEVQRCESLESLRGYEGSAARYYFGSLKHYVIPDWAEFERRSRNPPKSNVNAVLSMLYTLLLYRVETALELEGLDSCCGYLHTLTYGKAALAFDLLEEFRTPIADTLCLQLFNKNMLKPEDFREVEFSSSDDDYPVEEASTDEEVENKNQMVTGVLLTEEGLKKVIGAFESKMNDQIKYGPDQDEQSYFQIIISQVGKFKQALITNNQYTPFLMK